MPLSYLPPSETLHFCDWLTCQAFNLCQRFDEPVYHQVSNTPGLSTHTPALKGALDDNGYAKFSTMVRLTEEQYTIIGHIRFYVADADPTKPLMKYDVAIGISRNVQAQTTLCNAGSTYNVTTTECDICPHGTYQHKLDCIPCPPGTHGPVDGLATCLPCTKGYTNRSGMTECEPCPLHTQRIPGTPGIDKTECVCKFGFYDKRGPGEPCDPCPAGGQCDGEHGRPYPRPGMSAPHRNKARLTRQLCCVNQVVAWTRGTARSALLMWLLRVQGFGATRRAHLTRRVREAMSFSAASRLHSVKAGQTLRARMGTKVGCAHRQRRGTSWSAGSSGSSAGSRGS